MRTQGMTIGAVVAGVLCVLGWMALLAMTGGCAQLDEAQKQAAIQTNTVVQTFGPLATAFADAGAETAAKKSAMHRLVIRMHDEDFVRRSTDAAGHLTTRPADLLKHLAERDQEVAAIAVDERRQGEAQRLFRRAVEDLLRGVELATKAQVDAFAVRQAFGDAIRNLGQALSGAGGAVGVTALAGGL